MAREFALSFSVKVLNAYARAVVSWGPSLIPIAIGFCTVRMILACFSFNYPVRFGQTGSFSADAGG